MTSFASRDSCSTRPAAEAAANAASNCGAGTRTVTRFASCRDRCPPSSLTLPRNMRIASAGRAVSTVSSPRCTSMRSSLAGAGASAASRIGAARPAASPAAMRESAATGARAPANSARSQPDTNRNPNEQQTSFEATCMRAPEPAGWRARRRSNAEAIRGRQDAPGWPEFRVRRISPMRQFAVTSSERELRDERESSRSLCAAAKAAAKLALERPYPDFFSASQRAFLRPKLLGRSRPC